MRMFNFSEPQSGGQCVWPSDSLSLSTQGWQEGRCLYHLLTKALYSAGLVESSALVILGGMSPGMCGEGANA